MAYTTIDKPNLHFNTKLYTGTGSSHAITGVGFQPDWVWIKVRSNSTYTHALYDAVRGVNKPLMSSANNGEGNDASGGNTSLNSFDSDGFTLGGFYNKVNQSGQTFVSWNWKANGAGSSNTTGTINSTVSANTTAGFSIVKYTGNGVSGATVGHGLGAAPKIVLIKKTSSADSWSMLNTNINLNYYLKLEGSDAQVNDALFNNTAPSTTVFTIDSDGQVNGNTNEFIAYCFAEKTGYSKFGTYTGNSSTDGPFIYTGFKPAFIMLKKYSDTANWMMYDNKREGYNVDNDHLKANNSDQEGTSDDLDILSNGFKLRTSGSGENSGNFIYMAFGQSLVGSNNIPCTAR
jgi:hypothetical protein